jgi:hypothetical protein
LEFGPDMCFLCENTLVGLIYQNEPNTNKKIWKSKLPPKVKIFLWFLKRGVILTKDNLAKL